MEEINTKINRIYNGIGAPGQGNSADLAWEYCHKFFMDNRANATEEIRNQMALHLTVYLANWGMYRASSFPFSRDYTVHLPAIDIILQDQYNELWEFEPNEENSNIIELIFQAYAQIRNTYINDVNVDIPTDTLVSKIMLVTFACMPAFDTYVKKALSLIKRDHGYEQEPNDINWNGWNRLVQSLDAHRAQDSFSVMCGWLRDAQHSFNANILYRTDANRFYPKMKKLDMFLFSLGYEYDLLYGGNHGNNHQYNVQEYLDRYGLDMVDLVNMIPHQ